MEQDVGELRDISTPMMVDQASEFNETINQPVECETTEQLPETTENIPRESQIDLPGAVESPKPVSSADLGIAPVEDAVIQDKSAIPDTSTTLDESTTTATGSVEFGSQQDATNVDKEGDELVLVSETCDSALKNAESTSTNADIVVTTESNSDNISPLASENATTVDPEPEVTESAPTAVSSSENFIDAETSEPAAVVVLEDDDVQVRNSQQQQAVDMDPIEDETVNSKLESNSESILPERDQLISATGMKHDIVKSEESDSCECAVCHQSCLPIYDCVPSTSPLGDAERDFLCSRACLDRLRELKAAPVREIRVRSFAQGSAFGDNGDTTSSVSRPGGGNSAQSSGAVTVAVPSRSCANCRTTLDFNSYFIWQAAEFCTQPCFFSYQAALYRNCRHCDMVIPKSNYGKYCVRFGKLVHQFCNTQCLSNYKRMWTFCGYCQENISMPKPEGSAPLADMGYCNQQCMDVTQGNFGERKVLQCCVCQKFGTAEIECLKPDRSGVDALCSNPCFVAYKFVNASNEELLDCLVCNKYYSDSVSGDRERYTIVHESTQLRFCSDDCRKVFFIMNRRIIVCIYCKVKKYNFDMIQHAGRHEYSVCSQNCLQLYQEKFLMAENMPIMDQQNLADLLKELSTHSSKVPISKMVLTRPRLYPDMRNVGTMCKPNVINKAVTCRPRESQVGTQTKKGKHLMVVPVPVFIYVPMPVHMYVQPIPFPVPVPIPIPIPIFVPTTRKSMGGMLKEIEKIRNKVPEDPLEAEILMMADIAAGTVPEESESDSDPELTQHMPIPVLKTEEIYIEQKPLVHHSTVMDTGNNLAAEDMLQMALKMASDYDEPVDLEGAVSATHISAQSTDANMHQQQIIDQKRRPVRARQRGDPHHMAPNMLLDSDNKPDANMCLKYTFGVNAWRQWVSTKNADVLKSDRKPATSPSTSSAKLFKSDLLQLTTDELNFSLSLFVREVRKPNGSEYAPDTIYYLTLGIQQYLYENGRIDNLFCDFFYEGFTSALNEVCVRFASLYNESQYIVTRVEEEHLWESKQLGAHSPLVLLNTLMFFNTKHFALTTVEEHLQLSFSHIMKHWKRNPTVPGARQVLLRFYPPQSGDGRKKRVYEQQENDVNPLRCPVKLYEFYLSKCPESVKTRNDVFYLQPERSCVPDSPVWYSTMAHSREPLEKMLHRVKMVKEINIALLSN